MASVSGGHIACRIPVRAPVQSGHDSLLFTLPELMALAVGAVAVVTIMARSAEAKILVIG
jgi:hypothetical protein